MELGPSNDYFLTTCLHRSEHSEQERFPSSPFNPSFRFLPGLIQHLILVTTFLNPGRDKPEGRKGEPGGRKAGVLDSLFVFAALLVPRAPRDNNLLAGPRHCVIE